MQPPRDRPYEYLEDQDRDWYAIAVRRRMLDHHCS
jgi:hypothetical protein